MTLAEQIENLRNALRERGCQESYIDWVQYGKDEKEKHPETEWSEP